MITVTPLDKIGVDKRGYTYEYLHGRNGRHLVCFRKAGSINGRHYHKGISSAKDPEILILLHGTFLLNYRDINDKENQLMHISIEGPSKIEIPPYIWHEFISVSDCTFIELNSLAEHQADTFTN